MSDRYVRRLRAVRLELDIATEVLEFMLGNYDQKSISSSIAPRTKQQLERVLRNLELTYFVRLTAEFEGILKDHLRSNHPATAFPPRQSDWKMDWFLSRVLQREQIRLDPALRQNLDDIRAYRNTIAHGNSGGAIVRFVDALSWYNTFLSKLPDPYV